MWYELGKQKFDRQKNFSREMKGIEETMLKYLGKGDIIFLAIPLSTSTRRPGQDNPMSYGFFFTVFCFTLTNQKPGGYTFLQEANGDVLLDGVAFSRLD